MVKKEFLFAIELLATSRSWVKQGLISSCIPSGDPTSWQFQTMIIQTAQVKLCEKQNKSHEHREEVMTEKEEDKTKGGEN